LDEALQPQHLTPYHVIEPADSVTAITLYPFFSLQDPATALVLSSVKDHPIRLQSAFTGHLAASYPLVNPMTEAFISPHSLLFSNQGDKLVTGSETLISIFDISRPGDEPVSSMETGHKKRRGIANSDAASMRGIVSALAIDPASGLLAAGTYSRYLGLYDSIGQGNCIGVFSVKGTSADADIGGLGITQVDWSPCGRYLFISERKSDGTMVYDIRQTGQLLSWTKGRRTQTNQRLGVDLYPTGDDGLELWAGGLDGCVRMWRDAHRQEGALAPYFELEAHAGEFEFLFPSGMSVFKLC
jgi:telomerase Cajal body protein 1